MWQSQKIMNKNNCFLLIFLETTKSELTLLRHRSTFDPQDSQVYPVSDLKT